MSLSLCFSKPVSINYPESMKLHTAYIMVGLPGSGKTTWIQRSLDGDAISCSADQHHIREGKYEYRTERARAAHDACLLRFTEIIRMGPRWVGQIVVDNTNLTVPYIAPYIALAQAYEFRTRVIYMNVSEETAWARQTHGVDRETFAKMVGQLLTLVSDWPRSWPPLEPVYPPSGFGD
jgi:predicted kinase